QPRDLRGLSPGQCAVRREAGADAARRRPGLGARLPPDPAGGAAARARRALPARPLPARSDALVRPAGGAAAARAPVRGPVGLRPGRLSDPARPRALPGLRAPVRARPGGRQRRARDRRRAPAARRGVPEQHRHRAHRRTGARGRVQAERAQPRRQLVRARARDRRGPAGLFQGTAGTVPRGRALPRAARGPRRPAHLPAAGAGVAWRRSRVPRTARGAGAAGRAHQRRARGAGLPPAALRQPQLPAPDADRLLPDGHGRARDAAARRHEPGGEGVRRLAGSGGAARELDSALLVNPYDLDGVADAIATALRMHRDERRDRWRAMMDRLETWDITAWRNAYLEALAAA